MFEPGTQVGRYEIQRRLGRGGMGTVYVAHDPVLGRLVAIKVFAGDLDIPDAHERFAREARSVAALAHPNIVAIHDFGEYAGHQYIVMEYVPGETLAEIIRRKTPVSVADKLRWIEELTVGVGYAHQMRVIHRDIKPANLIVDRAGHLKILDFGIARILGAASHTMETTSGTPGYMAPEQILGEEVDGRADIFSIGVVFYELLSYAEAFPGGVGAAVTHRILYGEPVPLPHLVPDLNPDLLAIIERALKKSPHDRFPDADALQTAIRRIRRRFEPETGSVAPTVMRPTPAPAGGRPTTGSARRPVTDAVAVVTPPPSDRRTAQIEAALAQARYRLAIGELDVAVDSCQQALRLDPNHIGALELEVRIRSAIAEAAAADDRTMIAVRRTPQPDPIPDPILVAPPPPVARKTAPPAVAPPRPAPPRPAKPESAAKPGRPANPPGRSMGERIGAASSAMIARLQAGARQSAVAIGQLGAAAARTIQRLKPAVSPARVRAATGDRAGRWATLLSDRRVIVGSGVAVVVLAAAAVAIYLVAVPPPTGSVVIDAVPWGTVVAVESADGQPQALPSGSTPLMLTLPAGDYQVVVAGPDRATQRISVRVEPNGATTAPGVQFKSITPEEYFEQYLAAPAPPAGSPDAGEMPAAVPVDATPAAPAPTPAGVSE